MSKLLTISALSLTVLLTGCYDDNKNSGVQRVSGFGRTDIYRVYKTENNTEECLIIIHGDILEHNCFSDEEARRIIDD